ncbi:cation:dicarboxylase symporter family transporter [bacterium]|nr:cation:dicarboxylase symporter family transporter [bacterium]
MSGLVNIIKKSNVTFWTLFALAAGIIFGWLYPQYAVKMHPLATVFLRMIKMILAPLIFSTLVVGIAGHDNIKSLGKLGLKTIVYFEVVTTIALFLGLFVGNIFKPGWEASDHADSAMIQMAQGFAAESTHNSLTDVFINIFPTSITDAMASGNLLQIVVFAIFFALAACAVGEKAKPVLDFLGSVSQIMFKFTGYVMWFAPFGVFGAIATTIGHSGITILGTYLKLLGCVVLALGLFILFVLMLACKIVKIPFWGLVKSLWEPAILAFSTASSEAALPRAMEILEDFGAPKNIVGFVMPAGYTFNLDGSTLYLSLAVLFCTQLVGIDMGIKEQLVIVLTLMLTSKGIAAVPRVGLVILAGTLTTFNYPLIGVAVLLGIDQILDMGRTTVNLIGNCVATLVIARWDKQFDYYKMTNYLLRNGIKVKEKYLVR